MELTGRIVLITGATNGVGLEAALALAAGGADVYIVGRDEGRTAKALEQVRAAAGRGQVGSFLCDFSSQASIRRFADDVHARLPRIDVLINNAGGVADTRTVTVDGIEQTFAVNHLGYFLTTRLLLDLVEKGDRPRIVVVASVGHRGGTLDLDDVGYERGGYSIMGAYARSKLANVLFTRALARRLQGRVLVNALHPGAVATNIWTGAPAWIQPVLAVAKWFMISPAQGAKTLTFLAVDPSIEGRTGGYYESNREVRPAKLALDDALGERLWQLSERLVG